ncbi:glycosyltransferase family 2 protein [Candidatus Woesearchaeota archaeon]|nr:glycosyltransferase family 2 protein [Candidatus Woesearchaeota archaeon]
MKKGLPLVSVVILNFNGADYTMNCLDSIKRNVFRDYEVIVVDNGSTDNSVDLLGKRKDIRLVRNSVNLGFAEGNNVGVRHSRGRFVCLLNNDTLVDRNWLKELVLAAERNKDAAVFNPKFFDRYGKKDYHFHGYGTIGLFHAPVFLSGVDKDTSDYVASLTASGSAFFRKEVIGEPFDKDYFAYAEDAALGWRSNLMGHKVIHVPGSIVFHEGAVTAKRMDVPWDFFFILAERNKILNIISFYSFFSLIRLFPYFVFYFAFSNIFDFRHFFSRLKVFWWFLVNAGKVLDKRRRIQSLRKVPDSRLVGMMSCKIYDERYAKGPVSRLLISIINKFLYVYCAIVFFRTVEFHKPRIERGVLFQ